MMAVLTQAFAAVLITLPLVHGLPPNGESVTCTSSAAKGIAVEWPSTTAYRAEQALYWSGSCSATTPSCILVPKNNKELVSIIKTLRNNKERFAVKSGGHNPNVGLSSISGGPLISLKAFDHVVYDAISKTAKIGPGNRWSDVTSKLEPYNVAATSGRVGHVGVGGYTLGGGLSYLSTQHGWAMNTVIEYEVVLASGEVVTASKTKNSDLYKALKGGGNNFGIVTTYRMKVFPTGTVWGGSAIFLGEDKLNDLISYTRNFTENYPDDRAALILTSYYNTTDSSTLSYCFLFFDGQTPPEGLFAEIFALGPVLNTWRQTTYSSVINEQDVDTILRGDSIQIFTETVPLPNATVGLSVFNRYREIQISTAKKYSNINGLLSFLTFQPIPRRLAAKAIASGGDLLALDPSADLVMLEMHLQAPTPNTDAAMRKAVNEQFTAIKHQIDADVRAGLLRDSYRPLFQNDAHEDQDYFGRLRQESQAIARKASRQYDPQGLFRDRTEGFKP